MRYTPRKVNSREIDGQLYETLEPLIKGMKMSLIELNVFRQKARGRSQGSIQVKVTVYREGVTGLDDCSRVHRAILPRLELCFSGQDVYLEVSSPGIDRNIKDGCEFAHYIGQGVRCYCTGISDWKEGVLCAADEEKITLRSDTGMYTLPYEEIAKARLNAAINKLGKEE